MHEAGMPAARNWRAAMLALRSNQLLCASVCCCGSPQVTIKGCTGAVNTFLIEPFVPHKEEFYLCIQVISLQSVRKETATLPHISPTRMAAGPPCALLAPAPTLSLLCKQLQDLHHATHPSAACAAVQSARH